LSVEFSRQPSFQKGGNQILAQKVYKQLMEVMKNRRGAYAGMDIPEFYELVEALFTPDEAEVNNALPQKPSTTDDIAKEMGREIGEIKTILESMADKGLCQTFMKDGLRFYLGVPFMPGIFEYQFMPRRVTEGDKKIARFIMKGAFVAAGINTTVISLKLFF
jgi:hypothetical protein